MSNHENYYEKQRREREEREEQLRRENEQRMKESLIEWIVSGVRKIVTKTVDTIFGFFSRLFG